MEPLAESCSATEDGTTSPGSPAAEVLKPAEAPSDGEECPICMGCQDQEAATLEWKETPCGHCFHGRCVQRWLDMKGSCPMCRRQLLIIVPPVAAQQVRRIPSPYQIELAESRRRFAEPVSSSR